MSQIPLTFGSELAFYLTHAEPCPYLEGRQERKLFTRLKGEASADTLLNGVLTGAGFRRSHDILYRPACTSCVACVPVRLPVSSFRPSRSQRRLAIRNADLICAWEPAVATAETYDLFRRYVWARHGTSDMTQMSWVDYQAMIQEGTVAAQLLTLRRADGALLGCLIADEIEDGLSAVYSFFDPLEGRRSLGVQLILSLITSLQERKKPYAYLGYWIGGCRKMAYKTQFQPLEHLGPSGWQLFRSEE